MTDYPPEGSDCHPGCFHNDRFDHRSQFWGLSENAAHAAQPLQFFKNVAIVGGSLFYCMSGPEAFAVRWRFHQS
jgi:hypothetical protein